MTFDALLQDQAARMVLGALGSDATRATIDRALDEGIYLDAFIDAVHPGPYPLPDQLTKAFHALLAARNVVVPERREAMHRVIASHLRRVADERNDARVELAAMIAAIDHVPELRDHVTTFLGDAFGIERLIGQHWSFDELEERPDEVSCGGFHGAAAIRHLKELIRLEAIRWLDVHGT